MSRVAKGLPKKRSRSLAGVANLLSPGLGFLYLGKPLLAFATPLLFYLVLAIVAWTGMAFLPWGIATATLTMIGLWCAVVVAAVVLVRGQPHGWPSRLRNGKAYLAFFIGTMMAGELILTLRGELLGYESFRVPSTSMANTVLPGDFVMADLWAYRSQPPRRGDIVVYRYPEAPEEMRMARIIGLPGERIEVFGETVRVGGTPLHEPYVHLSRMFTPRDLPISLLLPDDAYFVMGDHRDNSVDSRVWGPLPADHLHGRIELIWFSWDPKAGMRRDRIGEPLRARYFEPPLIPQARSRLPAAQPLSRSSANTFEVRVRRVASVTWLTRQHPKPASSTCALILLNWVGKLRSTCPKPKALWV